MKKIYFVVNNELNYDQRMTRICTTLSSHHYQIFLVGKRYAGSLPLLQKTYNQQRIHCWFKKGKLAYVEFNLKLFFFLLWQKPDCICAIDLDTIFPVLLSSLFKRCKIVYDAHELFPEMKEIVSRPAIQKIWNWVERTAVPHFLLGYTVSESIAHVFKQKYGVDYPVIRNMPKKNNELIPNPNPEKFILYQGAVNHGRCLEYLVPAMEAVNARLVICGDGNFMEQTRQLVTQYRLSEKIIFKGMLVPGELSKVTASAYIGVNIVEPFGLNQEYSLANKFFDYIHAGIPQLTMDFIEYARINSAFKVAVLIPSPEPIKIASALNLLLQNDVLYNELQKNCLKAREIYNWQQEEKELLGFYSKIFN